jgi:ornithine cyclodeaminase/alanine dehydrogenase-like protein (mu-crystallin family)
VSQLLVLSGSDVRALLGYAECAEAMRGALAGLAAGRAQQPLRTVFRPDHAAGLVVLMPSYATGLDAPGGPAAAGDGAAYGLKAICSTPSNPAAGLDAHQGVVLLSSGSTGEPVALMNASALTEIRTAAVSVVATDLLARPDAGELAVIGSGVQARAHILALDGARQLSQITVAGRDPARAGQLVASLAGQTKAPVRAAASAREAAAGAGIIVTATNSAEPVLAREWIEPGTHVNAVGSCLPHMRELDTATMAAAALFADRRESLLTEAGDYVLAAADGAIDAGHVRAELGELLTGTAAGRAGRSEITVFKSLGLAVEDLAAADCAYRKALALASAGVAAPGTWVSF